MGRAGQHHLRQIRRRREAVGARRKILDGAGASPRTVRARGVDAPICPCTVATGELANRDADDPLGAPATALWLIEQRSRDDHDLPGSLPWDSHQRNTVNQEPFNRLLAATLDRSMAALDAIQPPRTVVDQTASDRKRDGRFLPELYDGGSLPRSR
jgi:hypothetical protein